MLFSWSFNFFFFNKDLKRILFFTCVATRYLTFCVLWLVTSVCRKSCRLKCSLMRSRRTAVGSGRSGAAAHMDLMDDEEEDDEDGPGGMPRDSEEDVAADGMSVDDEDEDKGDI